MYYGERFNSITHTVGAALAALSGGFLVVVAAHGGDPWKVVSFSIYVATLVALYLTSGLYHSVRGAAKDVLRKMDHCAIYLLIAGSYTPFTLVTLRGAWGWSIFGVVWALALFGITQEIWYAKGQRILSLLIYMMMG
jgi:hemolysin III